MSAYFITSSGTNVGKTFTSCAMLHAARIGNIPAKAYKPIISGWSEADDTDTAQIVAASGGAQNAADISPPAWRFAAPLSPHRAAALESRPLALDAIINWSCNIIKQPGLTLIEGVGGVMVPLDDRHTVVDWMDALNIPIILVVGSYLGTISHTLTAIESLRIRGLNIAALVMSETAASEQSFAEAQAGLAPFIADIPLRIMQPRVSSWREASHIAALIKDLP
jgi:dethiobiotin synthetase